MNKSSSTGSEHAGTLGPASHRCEGFYCLFLGNASGIVFLPGRHVKYMVNIYKKNTLVSCWRFFVLTDIFAVSEKVSDCSSACWPDGIIIMLSSKQKFLSTEIKQLTPRNGWKLTSIFGNLLQLVVVLSHYILWSIFWVGSIPGPFKTFEIFMCLLLLIFQQGTTYFMIASVLSNDPICTPFHARSQNLLKGAQFYQIFLRTIRNCTQDLVGYVLGW